jgi:hypothetical protein
MIRMNRMTKRAVSRAKAVKAKAMRVAGRRAVRMANAMRRSGRRR